MATCRARVRSAAARCAGGVCSRSAGRGGGADEGLGRPAVCSADASSAVWHIVTVTTTSHGTEPHTATSHTPAGCSATAPAPSLPRRPRAFPLPLYDPVQSPAVLHLHTFPSSLLCTPRVECGWEAALCCSVMSDSPPSTLSPPSLPVVLVCVLGCTGVVGQKFLSLLQAHPYFRIACLCASERSAGRSYEEAVSWKQSSPMPDAVRSMTVHTCDVKHPLVAKATVVFSALDASVAGPPHDSAHTRAQPAGCSPLTRLSSPFLLTAMLLLLLLAAASRCVGPIESAMAAAGLKVFSNAKNHRYDDSQPHSHSHHHRHTAHHRTHHPSAAPAPHAWPFPALTWRTVLCVCAVQPCPF